MAHVLAQHSLNILIWSAGVWKCTDLGFSLEIHIGSEVQGTQKVQGAQKKKLDLGVLEFSI